MPQVTSPPSPKLSSPSLRVDARDFGELWNELRENFLIIFADPRGDQLKPSSSQDRLYNLVYRLCVSRCTNVPQLQLPNLPNTVHPSDLLRTEHVVYQCIKAFLETHVKTDVLPHVQTGPADANFLQRYRAQWTRFRHGVTCVDRVCMYLNTQWIEKNAVRQQQSDVPEIHPIRELGNIVWRDNLYQPIRKILLRALLDTIRADREKQPIDHQVVKEVLSSLSSLVSSRIPSSESRRTCTIYEEHFERLFLEQTENYYSGESGEWLPPTHTIAQYMIRMESRLAEEHRRVRTYLHPDTEGPLMKVLVQVMIDQKRDQLLSEVHRWFDEDRVEEQQRLYKLLKRSQDGLEPLRKIVEDRIDSDGKAQIERIKIEAQKEPSIFVETLLEVHAKYEKMINDVFQKDQHFVQALEKGCKRFINRNALAPNVGSRSAELLAKYCHFMLKPNSKFTTKGLSESEFDQRALSVLELFKLLEDKDVFQNFYSMMLSRRLISNVYNRDAEVTMITRLRQVCGHEYTHKLHRMFQDMEVSTDLQTRFRSEGYGQPNSPGGEMTTLILTSGSWPLPPPKTPFAVPEELQRGINAFDEFYRKSHNGRKLSWLHQLFTGMLKTLYPLPDGATYQLQVSGYQMAVLLLWNGNSDSVDFQTMQNTTRLNEKDLAAAVQVLVKDKVLLGSDAAHYAPTERFSLNYDFKSTRRKVVLYTTMPTKGPADETTTKTVQTDRKYAIQAAVVRVMKARKTITHADLVSEVIAQLTKSFKPQVADIKKNIDMLIEKEYMERSEDGNVYSYVA